MKILAIDFSSSLRNVALAEASGGKARVLARAEERHGQSTHAFGMIEKLLSEGQVERAEIDCLAIGLGPGSYAGIRVSLSIAQGWQLATGVKTTGISSITCLAEAARRGGHRGRVAVVVDAQRGEFYLAEYDISDAVFRETKPLAIVSRGELESRLANGGVVLGPDLAGASEMVIELYPDAAILAQLVASDPVFVSADKLTPIYLRAANFVKAPKPTRTY